MSHKGLAEKDRQIEQLSRELQKQKELVQTLRRDVRSKEIQCESTRQEMRLQLRKV